jgi:hypothetical protein
MSIVYPYGCLKSCSYSEGFADGLIISFALFILYILLNVVITSEQQTKKNDKDTDKEA